MPYVEVSTVIPAPREKVWQYVADMPSYPKFMPSLKKLVVEERQGNRTVTYWEAVVKGATLKWREEDLFDEENYRIHYRQLSGDLKKFEGDWILEEVEGGTKVTLTVDFEIGIPMFAAMLNPVAKILVKENAEGMLEAVRRILTGEAAD
nr:MAG: cyclase [Bacillota bacterium]